MEVVNEGIGSDATPGEPEMLVEQAFESTVDHGRLEDGGGLAGPEPTPKHRVIEIVPQPMPAESGERSESGGFECIVMVAKSCPTGDDPRTAVRHSGQVVELARADPIEL